MYHPFIENNVLNLDGLRIKSPSLDEMQKKLVPGQGISIQGNVISATGGGGGGGATAGPNLYVKKTDGAMDVFMRLSNGNYIKYPLTRRYAPYSSSVASPAPNWYDNWGIGKLLLMSYSEATFNEIAKLFSGGEAEIAISTPSASGNVVFSGGSAHGFEQIITEDGSRCWTCLLDGHSVSEMDSFEGPVSKVELWQKTYIYQYGTQENPYAILTKHWVFENGELLLDNKIDFLRDIVVSYGYSAMMCVARHLNSAATDTYLTNKAIDMSANPFKVYDMSDGWRNTLQNVSPLRTRLVEFGDFGMSFDVVYESFESNPSTNSRGLFVSTNNGTYNKIYAQFHHGNVTSGASYHTKVKWIIK